MWWSSFQQRKRLHEKHSEKYAVNRKDRKGLYSNGNDAQPVSQAVKNKSRHPQIIGVSNGLECVEKWEDIIPSFHKNTNGTKAGNTLAALMDQISVNNLWIRLLIRWSES